LGKHSLRRRISWEKQLFSPKYAFGIVTLILAVLSVVFSQAPLTPSRVHQYKTVRAQRVVVHLADGSTALLGPATTLTVAPESIVLAGEAYFTIAPHPTHPLVIRTRNTTIGVLGTQFGVRQYSEDSTTRVVVAEGKVTLHPFHTAAQTVLTERMLAQVTDSGVIVEQGVAVREYMGWVHGDLIFNRATMYDVVQELARAYDADIRIADTVLARQPMTIEVSVKDEPLSLILTDMALTAHAHLQRDGRSYVIFPGLSSSGNPQPKQIPQSEKIYGR
jgi:ferric-dicitrate binding protein FerR (iron transport regulator)